MKILAMILALVMAASVGFCEDNVEKLRGYSPEEGYVYVGLGNYPQWIRDSDLPGRPSASLNWKWNRNTIKDPSTVTPVIEPIRWRVLEVNEGRAYLMSEYVLFATEHGIHGDREEYPKIGADFTKTDLCSYLNHEFRSTAFTDEEASLLLPLREDVPDVTVFIPKSADLTNADYGMSRGKPMKAMATEWAVRCTGNYVYSVSHGGHSPYWVQEQSTTDARHGRCTKADGVLGHLICDREDEGCRPAVYLDLTHARILSGTGTIEDPYIIGRDS